jgi:predicted regulator of Ras-like GTPase activity (Roadblock/LC7/MglB family)
MIELENDILLQLQAILNAFDEIQHIFILDREGFLISALSRDNLPDPEIHIRISAIFPAMFVAGEEQGSCFNFGEIEFQFTEYQSGTVFGLSCGAGVLCVAAKKTNHINEIYLLLKQFQQRLSSLLDQFYCSSENQLNNIDLQAMFGSELKN